MANPMKEYKWDREINSTGLNELRADTNFQPQSNLVSNDLPTSVNTDRSEWSKRELRGVHQKAR